MRVRFLAAFLLFAPPAFATPIAAALTADTVEVRTDFTGAKLSIYGAVDSRYRASTDVVVIARGPDQSIRVARKTRVLGLWLDTNPVTFEDAPGFYLAASTRPLADIAPYDLRRKLALGPEHLRLNTPAFEREMVRYGVPVIINSLGPLYDDYRAALLRLMRSQGLYLANPFGVSFIDGGLFRADLRLPSRAPAGEYVVAIYLFRDGHLLAQRSRSLVVARAGIERTVHDLAYRHPWFYGLSTVAAALLAGAAAARVFQRRWI
jgi:uncharacterized protein (TIGR02186 family)